MDNGLPEDCWSVVFPTYLQIDRGTWSKIKPVPALEEYYRTHKFVNDLAGLQTFLAKQDTQKVARFDDTVRRMNTVIGNGVLEDKQADQLKALLEEMSDLIYN